MRRVVQGGWGGFWGSKNWGGGSKLGGSKKNKCSLQICILQSGIMLKGQEKQQQVIKNSKKCFVLFFFITYMMFVCLLQWFTVWFLLRSRYLFDVVCYYFFSFIYQIKKRNFCCSIFVVFTGTLFTYYLDNNIGINRKITRNCLFCYVYCLFVVVCLLSFVLSFEVQRTVQCGRRGVNQKSMWPRVKSRGREGE